MTRLSGVNRSLAAAFRELNAAFNRLPPERRPEDVGEWGQLEHEIDRACAKGDLVQALAAIERWKLDQLARIEEASRGT